MEHLHVLLTLCCLWSITGTDGRTTRRSDPLWQNCAPPGGPLTIQDIQISPDPIYIPGDLYFSLRGYSNRTIGSSRIVLNIKRKTRWINIPIPCIFNIGSCTYPDMCTMVDDMIREDWLGIAGSLGRDIRRLLLNHGLNPSMCPQPPNAINIRRSIVRLPEMPAALYWFAEGVYEARIRVYDNSNDEMLSCLLFTLHVKQNTDECDGWFGCLFK